MVLILLTSEECDQPQESLLDKARRLYPIGTKFIPTQRVTRRYDISKGTFTERNGIVLHADSGVTIFYENKWAEIIK